MMVSGESGPPAQEPVVLQLAHEKECVCKYTISIYHNVYLLEVHELYLLALLFLLSACVQYIPANCVLTVCAHIAICIRNETCDGPRKQFRSCLNEVIICCVHSLDS